VRRHQHHPEGIDGEHHRDIEAASQLGQPFGMAGIGKAGQMESLLVGGPGDDSVHLSREGELHGVFHSVAGNPTGTNDPSRAFFRLMGAPRAGRDSVCRRDRCDLVFGSDDDNVRVYRITEGACRDLGTDPPRIAQSDRDPWHQRSRISTYVPRRRRSR
jgi:hypothetical protein